MDDFYVPEKESFKTDDLFISETSFKVDPIKVRPVANDKFPMAAKISREDLEWKRYGHDQFREYVSKLPNALLWKIQPQAGFDLGYFGPKQRPHEVIMDCPNIAVKVNYRRREVAVKVGVLTDELLAMEDPIRVDYCIIRNKYNETAPVVWIVKNPTEVSSRGFYGDRPQWIVLDFKTPIDSFNGFAYF